MWFSSASKAAFAGILALFPVMARAGLWSISYVNEPHYLSGVYHPTLQGAAIMDFGEMFLAQTRLSLSDEAYGLFEPRRDPRAWDVSLGVLGGTHVPFWMGELEASAGVGVILGRTQGELYYNHVWDGGLFPDKTREYQRLLYAEAGIPFQAQWHFGESRKGVGAEFSGFLSREAFRWGIGVCWQFYLGREPRPKPVASPAPPPVRPSGSEAPEPGSEELEERSPRGARSERRN